MSPKKSRSIATTKNTTVKKVNENSSVAIEESSALELRYEARSAPIPSASELEAYVRVYPDAAREIFDMARNTLKMRAERQAAIHDENMKACEITKISQFWAFLVFVCMIGAGCFTVYFKMETAACWAFAMVVAFAAKTGVRAFVPRSMQERRD